MKETGTAASLEAAQKAAAKVNAMLVAAGKLKLSELNNPAPLFVEEVDINDAPTSVRHFLTWPSTHEEISRMSGAGVSVRGRYMDQKELRCRKMNSGDRPLYLHIQGVKRKDVKGALGRIKQILTENSHGESREMQEPRPSAAPDLIGPGYTISPWDPQPPEFRPPRPDMYAPPPPSQTEPPPPVTKIFREKIFLPENIGLHPADIEARLIGESETNLRYIQEETGVSISIRGIGSTFHANSNALEPPEPLHFCLVHDDRLQFDQAKELVFNLTRTVLAEIQQDLQQEEEEEERERRQRLEYQQHLQQQQQQQQQRQQQQQQQQRQQQQQQQQQQLQQQQQQREQQQQQQQREQQQQQQQRQQQQRQQQQQQRQQQQQQQQQRLQQQQQQQREQQQQQHKQQQQQQQQQHQHQHPALLHTHPRPHQEPDVSLGSYRAESGLRERKRASGRVQSEKTEERKWESPVRKSGRSQADQNCSYRAESGPRKRKRASRWVRSETAEEREWESPVQKNGRSQVDQNWGGTIGQPHLAPVQVAPHQLTAPHVGHPQMPQGQVAGAQGNANMMHTGLAPLQQPAGAPMPQQVMPQQEERQTNGTLVSWISSALYMLSKDKAPAGSLNDR